MKWREEHGGGEGARGGNSRLLLASLLPLGDPLVLTYRHGRCRWRSEEGAGARRRWRRCVWGIRSRSLIPRGSRVSILGP
jgi:hypothetical protein